MNHPLQGLLVLEFCQYLSGPSASLRLADLGARVIKIENPKGGDGCRRLAIKNLWVDDNSLLFHTINRNKESFTANLKSPEDVAVVHQLIQKADVLIHNFRPGVMEKIGLDYAAAQQLNPRLVYAEISGYGTEGPWKDKPGQDLLLQAMSGLAHTTGNADDPPVPFGLAIADILCGAQLVQGVLAALIRRHKTGTGARIELSMLESLLDFQFELLTTYYASGQLPQRSALSNGHTLLGAPYGLHATADGYLAVAMVPLQKLAEVLESEALQAFSQEEAFRRRDDIKRTLAAHLKQRPSAFWMEKFRAADLWAVEVLDWQQLAEHAGFLALDMVQTLQAAGRDIRTTRCPIRFNGHTLTSDRPAPALGGDRDRILQELNTPPN
ncbi:CaiB/BaiF CoA transferase family protein [Catalinimonas alkaloidigena]|nr:CaiB/BaiF CoA-transferase family protein [Catalinimonas alkaloidigena]